MCTCLDRDGLQDMPLRAWPGGLQAVERGPVGGRACRTTKVVPKRLAGGMSSFRRASISSFSTGLSTTHTRPPSLRYARHTCSHIPAWEACTEQAPCQLRAQGNWQEEEGDMRLKWALVQALQRGMPVQE